MRLSPEDIEKLLGYVKNFLRSLGVDLVKVNELAGRVVKFLKQNEMTTVARIKLRICKMRDKIESKPHLKKGDKIMIKTLDEILRIIEEEEKKIDLSGF